MVTIIKRGSSAAEIKKKIQKISSKSKNKLQKFAGSLKSEIDPLEWQKSIRNEWE